MHTDDIVLKRIPAEARSATVLIGGFIAMLSFGVVYTFVQECTMYYKYPKMNLAQRYCTGLETAVRFLSLTYVLLMTNQIRTTGIAMTSISIQYSFGMVLLTMGFIASTGGSIAYNAILTTAQRHMEYFQWFPDNVGLAGGMIVGGYGCGAFILSPLQTAFINPHNYRVNSDGFFTQEDLLKKVSSRLQVTRFSEVPHVFIVMAVLFALLQTVGLIFVGEPIEEPTVGNDILSMESTKQSTATQLKSTTFWILFISLTCNSLWVQLVSGLYKAYSNIVQQEGTCWLLQNFIGKFQAYGQQYIHNDLFLSFVGSLASVFNACSRVIWGAIADQVCYHGEQLYQGYKER
uniref:Oxalate:formate antiporter n=1 Tax=Angiostrongylus cantonensis TaxID=6313 RepID=A0A0K0DHR5_ANGCA